MNKKLSMAALAVVSLLSAGAEAAVISQWNFNSSPADANSGSGTTNPSVGSGTATLLGVTGGFASGDANGGSSDPVTGTPTDDSGWQTSSYPNQGTGNKTEGTQYSVSTVGFTNIQISYDIRHSNTSARHEQVQYTADGTTWNDIGTLFVGNAGDTWFNGRTVDFSSIAAVANNPNFGFRVLAAFKPESTNYEASNPSSSYASSGTWRFDMVTVSGTAVPVPSAVWLFGSALLGLVGKLRRKG